VTLLAPVTGPALLSGASYLDRCCRQPNASLHLADLAGTTAAEVERLVQLGILAARDGTGPFLESDVPKVRLATACERAGLPMAGVVSAIRAGRLSFSFLEGAPFRRWRCGRGGPTGR